MNGVLARLERLRRGEPWLIVAVFAVVFALGTHHFFTAHRRGSPRPQIVIGVDGRYHWAYLTSIALFLGIAFAAQLEAVRAGVPAPASDDPLTTAARSEVAMEPMVMSATANRAESTGRRQGEFVGRSR